MKRYLQLSLSAIALGLVLAIGALAQTPGAASAESTAPNAPAPTQQQGEGAKGSRAAEQAASQGSIGGELAHASREAAGEGEENAQFKESPSVQFIARITGLNLKAAYWLSIFINFAILAGLVVLISKSKLPAMFRTRTGEIQRGISEARRASEDANRRLAEVESRLARLDEEVAEMRRLAEKEAAVQEERLLQAAEEDKRKIVESAKSEIAAAAKMASRDLKAYTADLAIALAEKRIRVDAETDRALVSAFVDQLNSPGTPGKDGQ